MEAYNFYLLAVLVIMIIAECIFDRIHNRHLYDAKESLANVSIFGASVVLNLMMRAFFIGAYNFIYQFHLSGIGHQWWVWIIVVLLCDFNYYWYHYLGHRIRLLWAFHIVHHSSPKMNFTTAIRLPVLSFFYRMFLHIPLAFIGFNPEMILIADAVIYLYTFFIHTETIKSLGLLEYIFNTPSHHRVHHASNDEYLDKNYGGLLIIWDKMFGTFAEEKKTCTYGITKPLKTSNPVTIVFHEPISLLKDLLHSRTLTAALNHLFRQPGWMTEKTKKTL